MHFHKVLSLVSSLQAKFCKSILYFTLIPSWQKRKRAVQTSWRSFPLSPLSTAFWPGSVVASASKCSRCVSAYFPLYDTTCWLLRRRTCSRLLVLSDNVLDRRTSRRNPHSFPITCHQISGQRIRCISWLVRSVPKIRSATNQVPQIYKPSCPAPHHYPNVPIPSLPSHFAGSQTSHLSESKLVCSVLSPVRKARQLHELHHLPWFAVSFQLCRLQVLREYSSFVRNTSALIFSFSQWNVDLSEGFMIILGFCTFIGHSCFCAFDTLIVLEPSCYTMTGITSAIKHDLTRSNDRSQN